jgi:hypothetical protein
MANLAQQTGAPTSPPKSDHDAIDRIMGLLSSAIDNYRRQIRQIEAAIDRVAGPNPMPTNAPNTVTPVATTVFSLLYDLDRACSEMDSQLNRLREQTL